MDAISKPAPAGEPAATGDAPGAVRPPAPGMVLARGVVRLLDEMGYAPLTEMSLGTGRRVDAIGMNAKGHLIVVEVKSCLADFRSDAKWHEYRDFCDAFYFAVPEDFPQDVLPEDTGLMMVDSYGGSVLRAAPEHPLTGARRKAMLIRFARKAATPLLQPAIG